MSDGHKAGESATRNEVTAMREAFKDRWLQVGWAGILALGGAAGIILMVFCVASFVSTVGAGLGPLLIPPVMAGVRGLTQFYREAAGRRLGANVVSPYLPRPDLASARSWPARQVRLTGWIVTDRATWRDLVWLPLNFVVGVPLAALSPLFVLYGAYGVLLPVTYPLIDQQVGAGDPHLLFLTVSDMPRAFLAVPLGLLVAGLGLWIAPPLLRAHARFTAALLGPTRGQLERRLARVTESRSEAVDSSAADLRRIERDLHDGVQVRLLALGMNLTAIQRLIREDPEAAEALLLETKESSGKALNELRDLVRGIHPPVLADRGLADAVRALAMDLPLRAETDIELPGRAPASVEAAVYFAVSEALTNVIKHAVASRVEARIRYERGVLRAEITDDGIGGADPSAGSGLRGVERRLSAFDGIVVVSSPRGGPTMVVLEVPCVLS
ncbi:sensor histidine kinase [Microtetraspora malaysiensis]|uniref:sensor histidine kinase n=1 Tax=Microtetraspora malaysiensis TaxID=161358 RepID=UPI003D8FEAE2